MLSTAPENAKSARPALILAVDDTPANLLILEKTLLEPNYRIKKALSGAEALRAVAEERPDLILLDIMMPESDGFDVCRQLKANPATAGIPVIFLTAVDETKSLRDGFALGAVDYIRKPFQTAELVARVSTHIEINNLRNHLEGEVARRTNELSEALAKLRAANQDILNRLSLAAEYRDDETSNHLKRMSRYSVLIGKAAGLDDALLENMGLASQMHDVGKIGIPDGILLKPGKLTADEFNIMKKHPKIGGDLLSGLDSEITRLAESIALTHHEKFDGTGYPHGLKGEAIPVEGRIVAIADVFDALTSVRPYKAAWSHEDAIAHIRTASGAHFDPRLVKCFDDVLPEILRTANEIKN